jgi:large subunit ribosomal protein L35
MPKIKTNKTAAKRFKITGTGKITRRKTHNSHQFLHKRNSAKRRLELEPEVFQGEQKRMRRLLILPLTKKQLTKAKPEVDRDAVQAESKAKLVTMLSA